MENTPVPVVELARQLAQLPGEQFTPAGVTDLLQTARVDAGSLTPYLLFDPARYTRNLLDLACVPLLHELTHLPIVVDPSHGTGQRLLIPTMARAAVACGADGLMIEMHPCPDAALSDAAQALDAQTFAALCREVRSLHSTLQRLQEEVLCTRH